MGLPAVGYISVHFPQSVLNCKDRGTEKTQSHRGHPRLQFVVPVSNMGEPTNGTRKQLKLEPKFQFGCLAIVLLIFSVLMLDDGNLGMAIFWLAFALFIAYVPYGERRAKAIKELLDKRRKR